VKRHAKLGGKIGGSCLGVGINTEATGYDVKLDNLKVHSMQVSGDALVVDFDGDLSVH
jgi:hypothetical protein